MCTGNLYTTGARARSEVVRARQALAAHPRSARLTHRDDRVALATRRLHEALGRPDRVRARLRGDAHGRAARGAARAGRRTVRDGAARRLGQPRRAAGRPLRGRVGRPAAAPAPAHRCRRDPGRPAVLDPGGLPRRACCGWSSCTLVVFLEGCLGALFDAAYPAYVPSLIGVERVVEGNSKLATSSSLAEIGGPGLAAASCS